MSYTSKAQAIRTKLWSKSQQCGICLQPIATFEQSTLDHILPRSFGGRTWIRNAQLAHQKCNSKKGSALKFWSSEVNGKIKNKHIQLSEFKGGKDE